MKAITILRLELLGNLLLSRLMDSVKLVLKEELKFDKSYYWTDLKITLSWIKSVGKEYNVFVENRFHEIWKLTDIKEWFYVDTLNNPADMITRQNFKNIAKKTVWWHGPSFLINDTKFNEKVMQPEIHLESDIEIQNQSNVCLTFRSADKINLTDVVNIEKFSSLLKLKRIIAFICRFMDNLKLRKSNTQNKIQANPILQPRELSIAEEILIRDNQQTFENESKFNILKRELNIASKNSVLKCEGRLKNAPITPNSKLPILINRHHYLAKLIIWDVHLKLKHVGCTQVLTQIRQKFWITQSRQFVRNIFRKCVICRKLHAKPYFYPEPPPLKKLRLQDKRAFSTMGIDNFGPLLIKNGYENANNKMHKAWVTLYTCASTRNIILDLIPSLSANSLKNSLKRFISRGGCPDNVISDNSSNFVAIETQNFASNLNINWHFNLALALWQGGVFERLIRSVKELLKKDLRNYKITFDELQTILLEIELIINNRPLTHIYTDLTELPLTPSQLVFSRNLNHSSLSESPVNVERDIYEHREKFTNIINHF